MHLPKRPYTTPQSGGEGGGAGRQLCCSGGAATRSRCLLGKEGKALVKALQWEAKASPSGSKLRAQKLRYTPLPGDEDVASPAVLEETDGCFIETQPQALLPWRSTAGDVVVPLPRCQRLHYKNVPSGRDFRTQIKTAWRSQNRTAWLTHPTKFIPVRRQRPDIQTARRSDFETTRRS